MIKGIFMGMFTQYQWVIQVLLWHDPISFKVSTQCHRLKVRKRVLVCRFPNKLHRRLKPQTPCVPTLYPSVWVWRSSNWGCSWHHWAPDAGGRRCSSASQSECVRWISEISALPLDGSQMSLTDSHTERFQPRTTGVSFRGCHQGWKNGQREILGAFSYCAHGSLCLRSSHIWQR